MNFIQTHFVDEVRRAFMKDKSYSFDFGCTDRISLVAERYLYLSPEVFIKMGSPREVNIGIDEQNRAMLIKPLDEKLIAKRYLIGNRKIYCGKIIEKIREITQETSFEVTLDKQLGGLLVQLDVLGDLRNCLEPRV